MVDKPSRDDIEKVSLDFAKTILAIKGDDGSIVIDETLIREATNLAMDWLAGKGLRSNIVDQHYADWVDLTEKNKEFDIEKGEQYWFVAEERYGDSQDKIPEIIEAKVSTCARYTDSVSIGVRDIINYKEYIALYFIPKNSSEVFHQGFQPLPPEGVKVKNNKFSPTMSAKD